MVRVSITLTAENGINYVPAGATVLIPSPHFDAIIKVVLAAASFTSCSIVRQMNSRVTTSFVTDPPYFSAPRKVQCLDVSYDVSTLHALLPDTFSHVDIASLAMTFPSLTWASDGGGQIVVVDMDLEPPTQVANTAHALHRAPMPMRAHAPDNTLPQAYKELPVTIDNIPGLVTEGQTRLTRKVSSVQGVPLHESDVIKDTSGAKWYYTNGALRDRLTMQVPSKLLKSIDNGKALVARHTGSPPPIGYLPDTLYELIVRWPASESGGYAALTATSFTQDARTWGWRIADMHATVEHPLGTCQGEGGVPLDLATPDLCVQAGGTWDRPCQFDTECPFYDHRRGRGGCKDSGFCEMPLGVDRRSFRAPHDTTHLMKLGCGPDHVDYPWCSRKPDTDVRFGDWKDWRLGK